MLPPARDEGPRRAPRCPHCQTADSEVISLFGTQAMTLQYRCRACGTCYEALKYDGDEQDSRPAWRGAQATEAQE